MLIGILITTATPVVLLWYSITFIRLGTDVLSILAPIRRTWRMQLTDNVLVTPVSGAEIVTATLAVVLERMRWVIPAGAVLFWCMYNWNNQLHFLAPDDPRVLQVIVFAPLSILLISTCGYLASQLIMLVLMAGGLGTRQRSFAWSVSAVVTLLTIFASALTLVVHVLRTEFEARTQLPVLLFASLGVLLLLGLATLIAIRVPFLRGSGVLLVPVAAVIVAAGLYLADNTGSGPASHSEVINAFSIIAPFNIIAASNPLLDGRLDAHQPFLYDSGNWRQRLLHSEGQEWWRWPHLIIAQLLALWLLCNMARLAVSVRRNM